MVVQLEWASRVRRHGRVLVRALDWPCLLGREQGKMGRRWELVLVLVLQLAEGREREGSDSRQEKAVQAG